MNLSICIPTYNRQAAVSAQIEFLLAELEGFDSVEVIVSDNASLDNTFKALKKIKSSRLSCYFHEENIGMLGNIKRLISYSKGRYIWLLSDDDVLLPGVTKEIVSKISLEPDIIFLNHSIVNFITRNVDSSDLFEELKISSKESFFSNISSKRFGQLMFMSASIHKRERLNEVVDVVDNIAAPLDFFLNGVRFKRIELVKEIFLKNIVGNESWGREAVLVFGKYVPSIIIKYIIKGTCVGFNFALLWSWLRAYWRHYIFLRLPTVVRVTAIKVVGKKCSKRK
ncbi:MAG TPA: glycosyltransferase family A protein [Methylotenera sp.]